MTKEELKVVLEKHKRWLQGAEGGVKANLSGANLSGADLYGVNLSGANLSGANLSRAILSRAYLSRDIPIILVWVDSFKSSNIFCLT